jgi:hypothetical protein
MDTDLAAMSRDELIAEVRKLRAGIRTHRDSSGHDLCWHHPDLWALLPEKTDPVPVVPEWPQFMRGCIRYRQSLDLQAPQAPRTAQSFKDDDAQLRDAAVAGHHQRGYRMLRGSCLCGKVRYELRGMPLSMYYCHCSMCRKATGSSFATNALVHESDFVVTSGLNFVKTFQSSPGEFRHFCSACGSPLYAHAAAWGPKLSIRCGGLDDDPVIRPTAHIHVASKAPWLDILDQIPQFREASDE